MEKGLSRMYSLVNEIFRSVRGPGQAVEIGDLERRLLGMVMEVAREALVEFVKAKGTGYEGGTILNTEGERARSGSLLLQGKEPRGERICATKTENAADRERGQTYWRIQAASRQKRTEPTSMSDHGHNEA